MKKRFLSLIAASMALALAFTSCASRTTVGGGGIQATLYAAGCDESFRPTIWKDGAPFVTINAYGTFNAVYASAGIVYAAGLADERPFYWKSNDPNTYHYLGSGEGWATSVCVTSSGYMYVAGWDSYGGKVWRGATSANTAATTYHDLGENAWPMSICVYGDTVYTGGCDVYGSCIWEGSRFIDGIDDDSAYIYSIDVSNGVVYAAGEFDYRPVWIKTGDLNNYYLGNGYGLAASISVSGGNIYIAEYNENADGRVWRGAASGNTVSIQYRLGNYAAPESVFVAGSDVYAGGWDGSVGCGRIWKNGARLYDLGYDTDVFSIFVQ